MQSTEEKQIQSLLTTRYEVIDIYPLMKVKMGDVLIMMAETTRFWDGKRMEVICEIEKYPKIFRRMHWSERRAVEDMPAFIKYKSLTTGKFVVWKVSGWVIIETSFGPQFEFIHNGYQSMLWEYHLPATNQEYITYLSTK